MNIFNKHDWKTLWRKAIKRDVVTTRIFFDPLAAPLTLIFSNIRWISPNLVTFAALIPGLLGAHLFFEGNYVGGAIGYYIFFLLDSIDGKLARLLEKNDPLGAFYDFVVDRIVIGTMLIGIMHHQFQSQHSMQFMLSLLYLYLFLLKDVFDLKWKEAEVDDAGNACPANDSPNIFQRCKVHFKPGQLVSGFIVFFVGPLSGQMSICLGVGIICVLFSLFYNVLWRYVGYMIGDRVRMHRQRQEIE